jgi:polysaccharide export outer membrane protein
MRLIYLIVSLTLATFACGDPPPSEYPTQDSHAADATFGAGDTFEVRVYQQEDMTGTYEVSSEGTISFPLIGLVVAEGKTPAVVEREIHDRLADGYLKSPNVSVLVKESKSKSVSVLGEVTKPVTLPYSDGMTVIDAIAKAGGFTAMARKNAVTITRTIDGKKTRYTIPVGDIGKGKADNFYLRPGDVADVPRRVW